MSLSDAVGGLLGFEIPFCSLKLPWTTVQVELWPGLTEDEPGICSLCINA